MKMRDWMNNNSALVTVGAVVVLILSLGYIVWSSKGPGYGPRVIDIYYYDLNTKQVFVGKSDQYPPIDAPSGRGYKLPNGQEIPAGVRAYVFACGECPDVTGLSLDELQAKNAFVAYVEMYTMEVRDMLMKQAAGEAPSGPEQEGMMYEMFERGQLIADPAKLTWVLANTEQAMQIQSSLEGRCPGPEPIQPCLPGR